MRCTLEALAGLPEIRAGDNLSAVIVEAAGRAEVDIASAAVVLVVSQKVVSKAEGRTIRVADVAPSRRAADLASRLGRDPREVEIVLRESRALIREERVLICETHHGFVCANAGVDRSNAPDGETAILLPVDPDGSARRIRAGIRNLTGARSAPGVIVADTFGRPWRIGQTDVALGCAGVAPVDDLRGRDDAHGRPLRATLVAVADEIAAAADLVRTKDGQRPVVVAQGLDRYVTARDGPGAAALVRSRDDDLFR